MLLSSVNVRCASSRIVERIGISNPGEFIRVVTECEQMHIVTFRENYEVVIANGDYHKADITLVPWADIPPETQRVLWSKKLRGQVCNAEEFRPKQHARHDSPVLGGRGA